MRNSIRKERRVIVAFIPFLLNTGGIGGRRQEQEAGAGGRSRRQEQEAGADGRSRWQEQAAERGAIFSFLIFHFSLAI